MRIALLVVFLTLLTFRVSALTIDEDALLRAAAQTEARLKTDPVTWRTEVSGEGTVTIVIDTMQTGDKRRINLSVREEKQLVPFVVLIERDNKWFVEENEGISGVYRPEEAPFYFSPAIQYLREQLQFVSKDLLPQLGAAVAQDGDVVTYRAPWSENVVKSIQQQITKLSDAANQVAELKAENAKMAEKFRQMIDEGVRNKVNLKTGLIVEYGSSKRRIAIHNFQSPAAAMDDAFAIGGRPWQDHTAALSSDTLKDCIMISHCGVCDSSEQPRFPPDVRLYNLKTYELRRVPVKALDAGPGCFYKDRTRVIVIGTVPPLGGMRPCAVDVQTGENGLVGDFPNGAAVVDPVLSHDGKTVALQQLFQGPLLIQKQIVLVDLETNTVTKVGEPLDLLGLQWLPDDKGFIVSRGISTNVDTRATYSLCAMTLDGKLSEIGKGMRPLLLNDGTILFQDETHAWHVCDMHGKILRNIADARQQLQLTSLTTSGDAVLGTRTLPGSGVKQLIKLNPKDGTLVPLTAPPGLSDFPVGR